MAGEDSASLSRLSAIQAESWKLHIMTLWTESVSHSINSTENTGHDGYDSNSQVIMLLLLLWLLFLFVQANKSDSQSTYKNINKFERIPENTSL